MKMRNLDVIANVEKSNKRLKSVSREKEKKILKKIYNKLGWIVGVQE